MSAEMQKTESKLISKNFHFWILLLLVILLILLHYHELFFAKKSPSEFSFFGITRHAIERIIFIIPVIYVTHIWNLKAGLFSLFIVFGIMFPRLFFFETTPIASLLEIIISFLISVIIILIMQFYKKQIQYKDSLRKTLQQYSDKLNSDQEEERKRIAREIHDDAIQSMVGISRKIDNIINQQNRIPKQLVISLNSLKKEINNSIQSLKNFIQNFRSSTLEFLGLVPAIRELSNKLEQNHPIKIIFEYDNDKYFFPPEKSLLIYRIIQEACQNIIKHASASEVKISMTQTDKKFSCTIIDDGWGFIIKSFSSLLEEGKIGIMGMKERANLLNADFAVKSHLNKGTQITFNFHNE